LKEYRAYFLGHDGHFSGGYEPFACVDDAAAIAQAKRPVNRNGIELWSGTRLRGAASIERGRVMMNRQRHIP
jgi:hypothetical protein